MTLALRVVSYMLSYTMTFSTSAPDVFIKQRVLFSILVTLWTASYSRRESSIAFCLCNGLQMFGVYTKSVLTKVIYVLSFGDFTVSESIGYSMCPVTFDNFFKAKLAIFTAFSAPPNPTLAFVFPFNV